MSELGAEDMMDVVVSHYCESEDVADGDGRRRQGGGALELGRRLLAAARDGDTVAVLEHMARGAPFTTDWLGTSPLHLAAANNRTGVCAVLLRAGVSRDCRTKVERTPLHLAAYWGHTETAELLISQGADVHCRDMLGMTALHWAAERGHTECARVLLLAGAATSALSRFHTSPLSLARARGGEMQELLENAPIVQDEAEPEEEPEIQPEFISTEDAVEDKETNATSNDNAKHSQSESQNDSSTTLGEVYTEEGVGARLLRAHGITMLPADEGGTALSALRSGRTILLSDAGKLMLKESAKPTTIFPPSNPPPAGTGGGAGGGGGMLLTATPVTSPPRGVKIFTINTKDHKRMTIKKIVNPGNSVKYVTLSPDGKILSPSKMQIQQAKLQSPPRRVTPVSPAGVKILLNKGTLKLLQANNKTHLQDLENVEQPTPIETQSTESVVLVPEQWIRSTDVEYLRGQLLATHATLHRVRHELAEARRQMAD